MFKRALCLFLIPLLFQSINLDAAISSGRKQIKVIQIHGLNNLEEERLDTLIQMKPGMILNKQKIQEDLIRLFNTGYFEDLRYELTPYHKNVSLIYHLTPNPSIEKIVFYGNFSLSEKELRKQLRSKVGKPYNVKTIELDKNQLEKHYHQKGYDLMVIDSIELSADRTLVIHINEGRIDSVRFAGLTKVKPFVVYRGLNQDSGKVFNSYEIKKDRNRLIKMGYFSSISLPVISQSSFENKAILTYKLQEKKSNFFNLGVEQLRDDQGIAAFFKISYNHLWLYSDQISLKTQLQHQSGDLKLRSYTLQYKQPWLLNRYPIEADIAIWQEFFREPLFGETEVLESERTGFKAGVKIPIKDDLLYTTLGYRFNNVDTTSISPDFTPYHIRAATIGIQYDNRLQDNDLNTGSYIRLHAEQGGNIGSIDLGGLDYRRWYANMANFRSVTPRTTLAVRGFLGMYFKDDLDINTFESEAFYLGGSNTVRGYKELSFVGNKRVLTNIEYRLRIATDVHTVLFYDIGNVFDDQINLDLSEYKSGYGIGFRYVTGIAPFRLDFARGNEWMIHFGLGQMF